MQDFFYSQLLTFNYYFLRDFGAFRTKYRVMFCDLLSLTKIIYCRVAYSVNILFVHLYVIFDGIHQGVIF